MSYCREKSLQYPILDINTIHFLCLYRGLLKSKSLVYFYYQITYINLTNFRKNRQLNSSYLRGNASRKH